MSFAEEIAALAAAPFAWLRLRRRGAVFVTLYALCAGAVLALVASLLVSHEGDVKAALVTYLFPQSWTAIASFLIDRFAASQAKAVLINAAVSGTMVAISVLLFPLKEKVSKTFEVESTLTPRPIDEFPLWRQALEESKLVFIYLTAQMTIFWIGYPPDPSRRMLATILSFFYLFATFTLDFVSPLLQRHKLSYAQILRLFARRPILLFGFGGLITLPAVLMGLYVAHHPGLTFSAAVTMLFSANLVAIVGGVIAGTWLASRILETAEATRPPHVALRAIFSLALVAAFAVNTWAFSSVAQALHHKSQILKCHYHIIADTLKFKRPGLFSLLRGKVDVGVRFDLRIENPTDYDVAIEKNRVEVRHARDLVAQGRIAPLAIPPHGTKVQTLALNISLHPSVLAKGRALFKDKWSVTLYIEVAKGLEFPIYLRHTFTRAIEKKLGHK